MEIDTKYKKKGNAEFVKDMDEKPVLNNVEKLERSI